MPPHGNPTTRASLPWFLITISLAVTALVGVGTYYAVNAYVLYKAEQNIQNLLLAHKGIHHYIQRNTLPALDLAKSTGGIEGEFYSPELFSSSFMVRNVHRYYNEERQKAGLHKLYYKMAANNPRNPVNQADELEQRIIVMFNQNKDITQYREIIKTGGKKYLYYALPFLVNQKSCLKCHGQRSQSPANLQTLYAGQGGFGEKEGEIRAIESIRAPMESEFKYAFLFLIPVLAGCVALMTLLFFNRRLSTAVQMRTIDLKSEVKERHKKEQQVIRLNQELEQRVEERTVQLRAANKELDAFAYSVSHDLRAPLRGIDGFSNALVEDYGELLGHEGKDYLNRVRAGCLRMGNLIDDLLKLSRLSRSQLSKETIDLSRLAHEVIEELREAQPGAQVELVCAKGIMAHGDATLLRVVLDNLLGNAFKFTSKTPQPQIEFGQTKIQGQHVFFVRDNGAGFDMEYAGKLFGAFQRLHSPHEFQGTGIGLATVQRIIYRHGGKIWAEGQVDNGATFYFSL